MRRASRVVDSLSRLDQDRRVAIGALLALPDPPDLRGRGYMYTCARDPRRDPELLKRDLGTAYVEWRRQDHADVSTVVSVRRHPTLRMVRSA